MKKEFYTLSGVINSRTYSSNKKFKSKEAAMKHIFSKLDPFQFTFIEDEFTRSEGCYEIKFSNNTRFIINNHKR